MGSGVGRRKCRRPVIDPDETVEFNGVVMAIRNIPSEFVRNMMGMGHSTATIAQTEVHDGPFPCKPEFCLFADENVGVWINNGENLVCRGCGLDCT